jgi:hypothetical protein
LLVIALREPLHVLAVRLVVFPFRSLAIVVTVVFT